MKGQSQALYAHREETLKIVSCQGCMWLLEETRTRRGASFMTTRLNDRMLHKVAHNVASVRAGNKAPLPYRAACRTQLW